MNFADLGAGQGGYNEDDEFYGYRVANLIALRRLDSIPRQRMSVRSDTHRDAHSPKCRITFQHSCMTAGNQESAVAKLSAVRSSSRAGAHHQRALDTMTIMTASCKNRIHSGSDHVRSTRPAMRSTPFASLRWDMVPKSGQRFTPGCRLARLDSLTCCGRAFSNTTREIRIGSIANRFVFSAGHGSAAGRGWNTDISRCFRRTREASPRAKHPARS